MRETDRNAPIGNKVAASQVPDVFGSCRFVSIGLSVGFPFITQGNVHSTDGWDEVLLPVIDRAGARGQTVVVRADAAFALPALYEALEQRGVTYAIRLPANQVLERAIEDLLTRPLRRLALPLTIQNWSLTSLQQRLFKTGGRLIRHARYFILQLAEGHLTRRLFGQIVGRIERLAWHPT